MKSKITEFTAHDVLSFVTGWTPFAVTMHAPHPPSKHINFVPERLAWFRINSFKVVSIDTVVGETAKINDSAKN